MNNKTVDEVFTKFRSAFRDFAFLAYGLEENSWHDFDRNIWLVSQFMGADVMLHIPTAGNALVIRRAYFQVIGKGRGSKLMNFLIQYAIDNNIPQIKIECVSDLSALVAVKYGFVTDNRGNWVKRLQRVL